MAMGHRPCFVDTCCSYGMCMEPMPFRGYCESIDIFNTVVKPSFEVTDAPIIHLPHLEGDLPP